MRSFSSIPSPADGQSNGNAKHSEYEYANPNASPTPQIGPNYCVFYGKPTNARSLRPRPAFATLALANN